VSMKTLESLSDTSPTVEQVEKAMLKMESCYDALVSANDAVISQLAEDCPEEELAVQINYLDDVNKARSKITPVIKNILTSVSPVSLPSPVIQPAINTPKCYLERLKVPVFSGNIREYPSWKCAFQNAMTKYCPDEEEQIQRLKDAVKSDAHKEILHCMSVDSAFVLLDQNYGNNDELMHLLLRDVKTLKPIKNSNSSSLKSFASDIRSFIIRITDLGKVHDLKADYVILDLLDKLPSEEQYKFKVYCRDKTLTRSMESLANWLSEEAQLRAGCLDSAGSARTSDSRGGQSARQPSNAGGFSSHAASGPPTKPPSGAGKPCLLGCESYHALRDCAVFKGKDVNDRWKIVKEYKCCFSCLKTGHQTAKCFSKIICSVSNCKRNHNVLLHNDHAVASCVNTVNCGNLPVVMIDVYDEFDVAHKALAMIDSGSQQSLVRKAFVNKLRMRGSPLRDLQIQVAGGGGHVERSRDYQMRVSAVGASERVYDISAMSLENVCGDISPVDPSVFTTYPHLADVANCIHQGGGTVDLLIGTNFPMVFKDISISQSSQPGDPLAKETPLGWVLLGDLSHCDESAYRVNHVSVIPEPNIARMFDVDSLGVKPTRACTCTDSELAETSFIQHIQKNVGFLPDGRIEMRMPWKPGQPSFPDNRSMAKQRLESLERKLMRSGKSDVYNEEIQKLVDSEFCVRLKPDEVDWTKPFWLLPHRAVERPDASSTQVRIVFDSAAEFGGICLNDALEKGPNYLNELFKVLVGWREEEIAYSGDIRKMFNMIAIHPDDQPFHRFLWRDCNTTKEPSVYQWTRLSFGDKSSPDLACSAIRMLASKNADENPLAKEALVEHTYMDDIVDSTGDIATAQQTIKEVERVLKDGCFAVKTWHSNDPRADRCSEEKVTSVLGHTWDKERDVISLKNKQDKEVPEMLTKRRVLGIIAQSWDPLGLIGPSMIKLKIEMQNLWAHGYAWDEALPPHLNQHWTELFSALPDIQAFQTCRSLKPPNAVGLPQLHGFSDGGEYGYGSCIFMRWCCSDGTIECRLVAAKPFVAPLKRKTIPRLELMGCVTLVRLAESVISALRTPFARLVLWSDSSTALSWIRSSARTFKPFVGVRVAEIQESFDPMLWRYVPSECNPADALTKGIDAAQLESWHQGPVFLQQLENDWPEREELSRSDTDDPERKPVKIAAAKVVDDILEPFLERTHDWQTLRRLVAQWLRFIANCQRERQDRRIGPISPEELQQAELCIFRLVQQNLQPDSETFAALQPIKDDDGLWRARGRLELAERLPYDVRHPILLPNNHRVTRMLLDYLHKSLGHPGHKRLIDEARQKFWIPGLRDLAKSTKCLPCRRRRRPLGGQQMGPLPPFRVEPDTAPFANTSVDLFGPLQVKVARKTLDKAYGCLFTCLTTRAVHTELVMSESTDEFLMGLRRFTALRGWPKFIFSDNGTNFVGAQAYLRDVVQNWNTEKIKHECAEKGTEFEWKFNCPTASHMNGAVESLIKSVKQAIDGSFGFTSYTERQWTTILYEVSHLVNSRPLYPSSDDVLDAPPITPNSILLGTGITVPQPRREERVNPRHLNHAVQQRVQLFWEQWMRHFAPSLVSRSKWYQPRSDVSVGDLCVLLDPYRPRAVWALALVEEVFPSSDGLVRKVKVKTRTGSYMRPIHKLCVIATCDELTQ